jgi:AraC family transcriptional regulator
MEVTAGADLPRGFVTKHLPARRWARFTHQGHVSSIADTCNAIFEDWAPKLAGSMADDVGFLEYYGPDFDPRAGTGTIEIWVALTD